MEQAVGPEKLEAFIASEDPGDEILLTCLGEETVRAMTLGQMAREAGGLSDETVNCLLDEAGSLDLRSLVFGDEIGPEFGVFMQATTLCLSDEELVRLMGFGPEDQGMTAEQLRCLLSSDPEAIAMLGQQRPEIAEVFNKCGIPLAFLGGPDVPPLYTPEEEACLIDAIGEPAMREVFGGQRSPTSEEKEAFAGCGVGGSPQMEFPDFETLPEIAAPMEIGTVTWPSSYKDASAMLERLPNEISGHRLKERHGGPGAVLFEITFGEDPEIHDPVLSASVLDLSQGDFFPADTTAGNYVALFAQGFDWEVLAAGREGSLGWVQIKTTATSHGVRKDVFGMLWGNDSSPLAFGAQAGDSAGLAAVVQAMVSVAR